jgi:hypothetical protein
MSGAVPANPSVDDIDRSVWAKYDIQQRVGKGVSRKKRGMEGAGRRARRGEEEEEENNAEKQEREEPKPKKREVGEARSLDLDLD